MTDYSVYLVTDSTMVPESSSFLNQVEQSVANGATLVQLREKSISTLDFIVRAQKVHEITKSKGIPLIINDRIDVALAIDAEGVHIGQDDMPAKLARKLMGPGKIVGVTCSNPEEVAQVCKENVADYVGLGTVYPTRTKTDVVTPQGTGPIGLRIMLQVLKKHNESSSNKIKSVAIGGINQKNAANVLYQCSIPGQSLDGVAVVSCIMASEDSGAATRDLVRVVSSPAPWSSRTHERKSPNHNIEGSETSGITNISAKAKVVSHVKPLIHHITNNVVKNFNANVTLAIGASPVMSELPSEFSDFAAAPNGALVANIGTPTPELLSVYMEAFKAYNQTGSHIIYDPVAAGATQARLEASRVLLNAGHVSVIKGNLGEISAIYKLTSTYQEGQLENVLMQGVDSVGELDEAKLLKVAKEVSTDFRCVVVVTGATNYVVEGDRHQSVPGGHKLMGSVTGTGCSLGSVIAAHVAAKVDLTSETTYDMFESVLGAVEYYNMCGSLAAQDKDLGPGTFSVNFIDTLHKYAS